MNAIMVNKFKASIKEVVYLMKKWVKLNRMMKFSKMMETKTGKIKSESTFEECSKFFLIILQYN